MNLNKIGSMIGDVSFSIASSPVLIALCDIILMLCMIKILLDWYEK